MSIYFEEYKCIIFIDNCNDINTNDALNVINKCFEEKDTLFITNNINNCNYLNNDNIVFDDCQLEESIKDCITRFINLGFDFIFLHDLSLVNYNIKDFDKYIILLDNKKYNNFDFKCTLFSTVINADRYIESFLNNISQLDNYNTEIIHIFSFYQPSIFLQDKLINFCIEYSNSVLVNYGTDPGLYGIWNDSIKMSITKFLSNANPDDLRTNNNIKESLNAFDSYKDIAVVSSKLIRYDRIEANIEDIESSNIFFNEDFNFYSIDKMFKTNGDSIKFNNIPHCMPVWKKNLHEKYGYFDEQRYGMFADYAFWLKVLQTGEHGYKINKILGYYFYNRNSYGRKDLAKRLIFKNNILTDYNFLFSKLNNSFCSVTSIKSTLPSISVITICKNAQNEISRTIKSVISQKYHNYEYIIIDGNSNDSTQYIINNYIDYIDIYHSSNDLGIYDAMNKALTYANGKYVIFMNAGDMFYDELSLSKLAEGASETDADVVGGQTILLDENNSFFAHHENFSNQLCLLRGMPFCHQAMIYKKELHKIYGFYNITYALSSDYDFILKLYQNNRTFYELKDFVCYFSRNGQSVKRSTLLINDHLNIRSRRFPFVEEVDFKLFKTPYLCSSVELTQILYKYNKIDPAFDDIILNLILYQILSQHLPLKNNYFSFSTRKQINYSFNKIALVIGNGPSLRKYNFKNDFSGYISFGMNAAYRYWHSINWYPDYYSCLDEVVGISHKDAIKDLIINRSKYGIKRFLLRENLISSLGTIGQSPCIDNFDLLLKTDSDYFPSSQISTGSHTLAWASWLGYKDIILLGIDAKYVEQIPEAKLINNIQLQIKKTVKHNPNYFFDDYQQKGDIFHIPNTDLNNPTHIRSWDIVSRKLYTKDTFVANANPDSNVTAFYKSNFNTSLNYLYQKRFMREFPDLYLSNRKDSGSNNCDKSLLAFDVINNKQAVNILRSRPLNIAIIPKACFQNKKILTILISILPLEYSEIYIYACTKSGFDRILFLDNIILNHMVKKNLNLFHIIDSSDQDVYIFLASRFLHAKFKILELNIYSQYNISSPDINYSFMQANKFYDQNDFLYSLALYQNCFSKTKNEIYSDCALACADKMNFYHISTNGLKKFTTTQV